VSKRGLPSNIGMRHDAHYVEELVRSNRSIGRIIPVSQIEPNPEQPRVEIGDLTDLVASVKEKGVLEPLLVKPNRQSGTWMIIAGERRWRAANLAGLKEVPCIELDIDEKSIAEIALIENLQRKDLTVWEEADGLKALGTRFGYKHEEIAKKISKSRTTVTELLTIAGLPESIREKCQTANINAKSVLLEVARQFDERAMHKFLDTIQNKKFSREEIRQTARPHLKENIQFREAQTGTNSDKSQTISRNSKNFHYNSEDFSLEIKFKNSGNYNNEDIVNALQKVLNSLASNKDD
jgi:ParB family transcriptional regulator, chromosome partitioning protein